MRGFLAEDLNAPLISAINRNALEYSSSKLTLRYKINERFGAEDGEGGQAIYNTKSMVVTNRPRLHLSDFSLFVFIYHLV